MKRSFQTTPLPRRTFLAMASATVLGATWGGGLPQSVAATRHPTQSGTLHFGARLDAGGLDSHRHNQLHTSHPTALMYTGLTDLDAQGNIVPGIAESWEPSPDLTSWVFRLRKGVLFHNGREVDAEAVKLNILRIQNPAIGSEWHRSAVETISAVDVLDKYTVRFQTNAPDASMPSSVMHYPTNLQAPDTFDTASEHPVGTGPFRFVKWDRFNETRLVRFENYWETDAAGHSLPYLDALIGKPKREDAVRLTALRTGQVQLIDAVSYADVERLQKSASDKYHLWQTHFGSLFVAFNCRSGPFHDQRLRMAAAYALDRNALHHSVFYGQGALLDQHFPPGNPWHVESRRLEYDPDRAKALLKQARAVGTEIKIICSAIVPYLRESTQVVQEMWHNVGFKVLIEPLDTVPFLNARKQRAFDAQVTNNTYRFDPDDWFGRSLHSQSEHTKVMSGWQNERYDHLVEEAKKTLDRARRHELYTAAWQLVTTELPHVHLHEVTLTSAALKSLRNYQPNTVGALTYRGGGLRSAYLEA